MEWQLIETAPKELIYQDGHNHFGEYILVYCASSIAPVRARWWARDDSKICNFIADGNYAVYPSHWMPLPPPPKDDHATK